MTHGEQEAEAVRKRHIARRRWEGDRDWWLFVYFGLKGVREDRPPVDLAATLWRIRIRAAVSAILGIGVGVLVFVGEGPTFFSIVVTVLCAIDVYRSGRVIVDTRRTKRGRGLSGLPPRELLRLDELLAERARRGRP
jgi:hypothetical protein